MENSRQRLFEIIKRKSFIYREDPPFTLVSGKQSPYYFNCKATTLDPEGCFLIGRLIFERMKDMDIHAAGGLTLGADPISLSVSMEAFRNDRIIYPLIVRKEPKRHGTEKWIEGNIDEVKNAIAIDDVITTGNSTIQAIERMRKSGLNVKTAFVIIDREEGGKENIEALNIEVTSLFKKTEFN